jgi:hypothetical protein
MNGFWDTNGLLLELPIGSINTYELLLESNLNEAYKLCKFSSAYSLKLTKSKLLCFLRDFLLIENNYSVIFTLLSVLFSPNF